MAKRLAIGSPRCHYCERHLTPSHGDIGTSFTFDHVRPASTGGTKRVPCCRKCNQLKGDLPAHDWYWFIRAFPRWWKLFDTAAQVADKILDEHRRRAYARLSTQR